MQENASYVDCCTIKGQLRTKVAYMHFIHSFKRKLLIVNLLKQRAMTYSSSKIEAKCNYNSHMIYMEQIPAVEEEVSFFPRVVLNLFHVVGIRRG